MLKIAVLVSGGGTNLQALIDAQNSREEPRRQNRAGGFLQQRGLCAGTGPVSTALTPQSCPGENYATAEDFDAGTACADAGTCRSELVVSGRLHVHSGRAPFIRAAMTGPDRQCASVADPVLLWERVLWTAGARGGAGLWRQGDRRHRPFCQRGARRRGRSFMQKAVEVLPDDTPETLQRRVMEQAEWETPAPYRGDDLQRRDQVTQ